MSPWQQKAMAKMDKYSRQEVLDNDWLKKEVGSQGINIQAIWVSGHQATFFAK